MDEPTRTPDPPPAHFPLVDFLADDGIRRLAALLTSATAPRGRSVATGAMPGVRDPAVVTPGRIDGGLRRKREHEIAAHLERLFEGVTLCRFDGRVVQGRRRYYSYEVGLSSARRVGFVLPNPFDTLITFGGDRPLSFRPPARGPIAPLDRHFPTHAPVVPTVRARKTAAAGRRESKQAGSKPADKRRKPGRPAAAPAPPTCDFNARFVIGEMNRLEILHIYGPTIRIYFSKGLVCPVRVDSNGRYVPTGERQGVALQDRVITIARGQTPRVSAPLVFDENLVRVGGQNLVARLRQVTLGGTAAKPKLVFDQVELTS